MNTHSMILTPFLREHKRRPNVKQDGLTVWLEDQIAYLETLQDRRIKFGDGALAAYKHVLHEVSK